MLLPEALAEEAGRQLEICNACRYCEGYCAVFPATERRAVFTEGDIVFLANLCHDCRACYQACMFAPPHDFAVDLPKLLADARAASYRGLTWPARLAAAFERPFATQIGALAIGLALIVAVAAVATGRSGFSAPGGGAGSFYRVIPSTTMTLLFVVLGLLSLAAMLGSVWQFWRSACDRASVPLSARALLRTAADLATLRFLGGGGGGCYYPDPEVPARGRRTMHLLVLYGLGLAFAATIAAAIEQHFLDRLPPYPVVSVPVLSGIVGGAAIVTGGIGLAALKTGATRRRDIGDPRLDYAFLITLEVVAVTGLLLLVLRTSGAMSWLLILHLAAVVALYAVVPFSKLVHASHRLGALVLDASEGELRKRG